MNWINSKISSRGLEIKGIADIDGIVLINLMEVVTGAPSGQRYNKVVKTIAHATDNADIAIRLAQDLKVPICSFTAQHIIEKNEKMLMGFIHGLVVRFAVAAVNDHGNFEPGLLKWAAGLVGSKKEITDFASSFADGIAFYAIVNPGANAADWTAFQALDLAGRFKKLVGEWQARGHVFKLPPARAAAGFSKEQIVQELIRERHELVDDKALEAEAKTALLSWAAVAASGHGIEVTDLHKTFVDGRAYLAILDNAWPGEIDFAALSSADVSAVYGAAAEEWQKKGHKFLLDPRHAAGLDERSLILQLSELFIFFEEKKATDKKVADRIVAVTERLSRGLSTIELKFHVRYFTHFGYSIYVSGDVPELGSGDKGHAVKLNFEHGKSWAGKIEIALPAGTGSVSYKYLVEDAYGNIVDEEADPAHALQLKGVAHESKIVLGDAYHTKQILVDYNKWESVHFTGAVTPSSADLGAAAAAGTRVHIAAYVPTVTAGLTLFVDGGPVVPGDPSDFPSWKFAFDAAKFPFTWKFGVVVGGNTTHEEKSRKVRVPIDDAKVIVIDNWIAKPLGY